VAACSQAAALIRWRMPQLHVGWRVIGVLVGFVCLGAAGRGVLRGNFHNPDDDTVIDRQRSRGPFWFNVGALTVMGLYFLAVALGIVGWSTGSAPW
jgi:hypothetical protein